MSSEKMEAADDTRKLAPTNTKPSANASGMSWLKPALRSRRTLKTWFRCVVALTATLVLMVDTKTSNTMGQAAFFCVIVGVMLPPVMALSVFIAAVTTLLFGMLFGWALANAAMASALSVRSGALLAQQQQKLQSSINPNLPIASQTQEAVFHGAFLDPRSSAVYGAFLFIGTFALDAVRAYVPNLALLAIFSTIVLDVVCTTGPLLPTAQYTLAKSFIIPTTFYVAVALTSLALIFPESLSHIWLTSLVDDYWTSILDLLRLQAEAFDVKPSNHEAWAEIYDKGNETRIALVEGTVSLLGQLGLIGLDFSVGRLGPADLKRMNAELRSLMVRASGIQSFQAFVNEKNKTTAKVEEASVSGDSTPRTINRFQAMHRKVNERELEHGHDLDTLLPILASSSANLRTTCEATVECVMNWTQNCNSRRWRALFSKSTKEQLAERQTMLTEQLRQLEEALDEFRTVERVKLVKPYEKFFDPKTKKLLKGTDMFASRSLFVCFVLLDTLDAFAERLVKFLRMVIEIDEQRPQAKFWFPGRITTDSITNNEYKGSAGPFPLGTTDDPTTFSSESSSGRTSSEHTAVEEDGERPGRGRYTDEFADAPVQRNPDAVPPKTSFGRFFLKLAAVLRFFKSPQGIFALRHAIISVALWVPAVCTTSAWFYYENKGLWALIMAQMALALYAGDQIAGFLTRLVGTLIGLLIGMAVWYIGAARGHGNPYGVVIATVVFLAPFLFARIAAPPAQSGFYIMVAVTIVFVSGYSWINAHQNAIGNPGIGIALGWKRALLVIIGFTAANIVMLFPNPISSRVLVRKSLAATLAESGHVFAGEVEALLAEEAVATSGRYEKVKILNEGSKEDEDKVSPKERRVRKIGKRVLAVAVRMRELRPSLTTARFEPQLSGTWPHAEYQKLFDLQSRVLGAVILLITSFAKLDTKWCSILVHKTPFLNPNFLSDVFTTVAVLSNALMDGHPLPAYLPNLRDRLVYHEYHSGRMGNNQIYKPALSYKVPGNAHAQTMPVAAASGAQVVDGQSRTEVPPTTIQSDQNSSAEELVKTNLIAHEEEIREAAGPAKVDGSSMGIETEELTLDVLTDEQLPVHSTAIVALSALVSAIDEMTEIVKTLCGEATFRGYDTLQRFYLDQEEKATGGGGSLAPRL